MLGSDNDVGFAMAPPRAPWSIKYGAILRVGAKLGWMERKKSFGVVGCEGIELNGKVVVGWEGCCCCGRPLEGEV